MTENKDLGISALLKNKPASELLVKVRADVNKFLQEVWYASGGSGRYSFDGEISARDAAAEQEFFGLLEVKLDAGVTNPYLLAGLLAYANGFRTVTHDGFERFEHGGKTEQRIRVKLRNSILQMQPPADKREAGWINSIIACVYFSSLPTVVGDGDNQLDVYRIWMGYLRSQEI